MASLQLFVDAYSDRFNETGWCWDRFDLKFCTEPTINLDLSKLIPFLHSGNTLFYFIFQELTYSQDLSSCLHPFVVVISNSVRARTSDLRLVVGNAGSSHIFIRGGKKNMEN